MENFTKIYIISYFHPLIWTYEFKLVLIPHLRYMLSQRLPINNQICWFGRRPALLKRCYAKITFKIDVGKTKERTKNPLILRFLRKYTRPISSWKIYYKDKILILLILFQLQNLCLWQAAHCTLKISQCTLSTAPVSANAPESAPLHFILENEHCTLLAIHLY